MSSTDDLTDELAAKDALIRQLLSEKHAQAELLKKQRDILIQYLVLDIEDYLAEAREKAEEAAHRSASDKPHQSTLSKCHNLHRGLYNNVSIISIIHYQFDHMWEQWATNPYGLHASWHVMILLLLWTWLVGSVVVGYYEAGPDTGSLRLARMGRAFMGAIPPIVQLVLFLFPPLFVNF